ncbi:O-antigen polymerase [Clostridium sp.]|uniref:O-antigen polymerase n=1 Tax=Clostridium sp. TaxID=1506 RepID=UPI001A6373E8|nr:O-antigen polymerase [Clostridium sp.]MBK5240786.1 oligosaccharide repeat unit polymerase [Clostridium sp.]
MKKKLIPFITFITLQIVMLVLYKTAFISPLIFTCFICILYAVSLPKYLFSPQNIIFAYYFLWYGLAPAFALRFQSYTFTTKEEKLAYLMLFFTYGVSIVFLTLCESFFNERAQLKKIQNENFDKEKIGKIIKVSGIITLISLVVFIYETGGISYWIMDSKMAFLTRQGAGAIYLAFTQSLMIFASAYGCLLYKNKSKLSFVGFTVLILLMYPFIGSKAKVILIIFIGYGLFIINKKIISKWTFVSIISSTIIFSIGIFQRNIGMKFAEFLPYTLNYFNTYEMFVTLLRDFKPSFLKTFFLPFNKVFLIFGRYNTVPFHDMSSWLTSIYYPTSWAIGATEQWPIEADLYMSFYFILGIPILLAYLTWISYAFYMARKRYLSWVLIYIMEFVFILSHYRGGILIWWYLYLIPFYILVIVVYGKMNIPVDK